MVQKVLRHADPRITSERYAHLEQDYLGAEMRKLSLIPLQKTRDRHGDRRLRKGLQTATWKPQ